MFMSPWFCQSESQQEILNTKLWITPNSISRPQNHDLSDPKSIVNAIKDAITKELPQIDGPKEMVTWVPAGSRLVYVMKVAENSTVVFDVGEQSRLHPPTLHLQANNKMNYDWLCW